MQCRLARSAAPFGTFQPAGWLHKRSVCGCRPSAFEAKPQRPRVSRLESTSSRMPHASPNVRRDFAARAEEGEGLLVSSCSRAAAGARRRLSDKPFLPQEGLIRRSHSPFWHRSHMLKTFVSQAASQSQTATAAASSRQVDWVMTALVFLFPAIGGLLFGYDIGATSGALVSITSEQTSGTDW